ncbi:MAG: hypothetical protein HW397_13, partial [Dehalococcoidia bacterium]|nr:hypothetical protein [Dehalococcoidia bacterium]
SSFVPWLEEIGDIIAHQNFGQAWTTGSAFTAHLWLATHCSQDCEEGAVELREVRKRESFHG